MTVWILFLTFLKIGLFTIGGGYAMIPMILQDVTEKRWMTQTELIDFIAVAESTPGPFSINIATFIGTQQAGFPGALAATLGVVAPSYIIILLAARCFGHFQNSAIVTGILSGLRPAAVGLIGAAAIKLISSAVFGGRSPLELFSTLPQLPLDRQTLLIFCVILGISLVWKKVHPLILVAASGVLGVALSFAGQFISP